MSIGRVLTATERYLERVKEKAENDQHAMKMAAVGAGVALCAGVFFWVKTYKQNKAAKPSTLGISGGGIENKNVLDAFKQYTTAYETHGDPGIADQEKAAEISNTYYNLATDFYEWGWGQNFHFSPPLPGKSLASAEIAHQSRIVGLLGLKPGMTCIDCGCGIGGPMRTISSLSGAQVLGVTINQYQVDRANYLSEKTGARHCAAVQGNFMELKSKDNEFDAAYAIEATCHAQTLESVYSEVFRVLKPGAKFVVYEWLKTPLFDESNDEHVKIIDDICRGNGLPNMRTAPEAVAAAKSVGFKVIDSRDLGFDVGGGEWYDRLASLTGGASFINKYLVDFFSYIGLLSKGFKEVHDMLFHYAAGGLIAGGQKGIFTPMYLIVMEKPET